jgi:hypothetical protein
MGVLKVYRNDFRYSRNDLKGINPSISTYNIFMDDGVKPFVIMKGGYILE